MKSKILIIGGYGTVGRIVSEKLSELYPNQIIITGRNLNRAKKCIFSLQRCHLFKFSHHLHKFHF